jgi:hypothetical protein
VNDHDAVHNVVVVVVVDIVGGVHVLFFVG